MHGRIHKRHLPLVLVLAALAGCDGTLSATNAAPAQPTPAATDPGAARTPSPTPQTASARSGESSAHRAPSARKTPAGQIPTTGTAPRAASNPTRTTSTTSTAQPSAPAGTTSPQANPATATVAAATDTEATLSARTTEHANAAADVASQPDIVATEAAPVVETPTTAERESGSSFWAYAFGLFLMAAVGGGAWLMLQPPWKRWRWYWALHSRTRGLWLKYVRKNKDGGAPPSLQAALPTLAATPRARGRARESEIETMINKPSVQTAKTDEAKHGVPLKPRDSTVLKRGEGAPEVVSEETEKKARKRKRRNTEITLPVIPLTNPHSTKKN
jgi:hypothetical protein